MFEFFQKGGSVKEARKKWPKRGAILTNAIQLYLEWVDPRVAEWQRKAGPLESKLKTLEEDIRLKTKQDKELVDSIITHKRSLSGLDLHLKKIEAKIEEREEALKKTEDLAKRGLPLELIRRLHILEFENGEELTSRIETVEAHELEKKNHTKLVGKNEGLERNVKVLEGKKVKAEKFLEKLEEETKFQQNELELKKKETRSYRKVVDIVEGLIQDGYSFEDLKSIRNGLKVIALKGKPKVSLSEYLEGLQSFKTLNKLYDEIEEREKTLKTLNHNISLVKGELDAYQKTVLKTLETTKKQAVTKLEDVKKKAVLETTIIREVTEKHLKEMGASYIQQLKTVSQEAMNGLSNTNITANSITKHLDDETKSAMAWMKLQVVKMIQQCQGDIDEWRERSEKLNALKDQIRDQEILWKYGVHFLGVLKYPYEEIKEVPINIIALLMDRINIYTQVRFSDLIAHSSEKVYALESKLHDYIAGFSPKGFKLPALTLFCKEEFEKLALEEAKR